MVKRELFTEREIDILKQYVEKRKDLIMDASVFYDNAKGDVNQEVNNDQRKGKTLHLHITESKRVPNIVQSRISPLAYEIAERDYAHGIPEVQYAIYDVGDFFDIHRDVIRPDAPEIRCMTTVVNLTDGDQYEGGDLLLYVNGPDEDPIKLDRKKGSSITFPAFILHEVTPITSGHRVTLVSWIYGTPYDLEQLYLKWEDLYTPLPVES